jgi:hypothetical protein
MKRLFCAALAGVLVACLFVLAVAGLLAGGRNDAQATQTRQAVYQQWDAELHATMTAEAP